MGHQSLLTAQEQLLLRILTDPFNQKSIDNLGIADFYNLINKYRLSAFFYTRLSEEGLNNLPLEILDKLRKIYLLNLHMHIKQKKETLSLIQAFNENSVSSIVLKGPLLGERIYDKEGIRATSADIDLVIKYQDLPIAQELLSNMGYKIKRFNYKSLADYYGQIHYTNAIKNRPTIDLHWKPIQRNVGDFPISIFWENNIVRDIEGISVRFFSDDSLFIYLCIALFGEIGNNTFIKYLLDLHYFLLRYKDRLDYKYLTKVISKYNLKLYMYFGLEALNNYLGQNYNLDQEFLDYLKLPVMKKKALIWAVNKKYCFATKNVVFLKKKIINVFLASRCSLLETIGLLCLNCKISYLLFLNKNNLRSSMKRFVSYFLSVFRRLWKEG